jgi:hypothetical protein
VFLVVQRMQSKLELRRCGDPDDQHLKQNLRRHVADLQVQARVQNTRWKQARTKTHEESTRSYNCVRCMRTGHTGCLCVHRRRSTDVSGDALDRCTGLGFERLQSELEAARKHRIPMCTLDVYNGHLCIHRIRIQYSNGRQRLANVAASDMSCVYVEAAVQPPTASFSMGAINITHMHSA